MRATRWTRAAFVTSIALLSTLVSTGCGEPPREPGARPLVRVAVRPFLTYAPLYVAEQRGYFADQGIDIEFVQVPSAARAIPLLVAGDIDVLPAPISPAFLYAIATGERVRYVADKGWVDPSGCDFTVFAGHRERFDQRAGTGIDGLLRVSRSQEPQLNFFVERVLARNFDLSLDHAAVEAFNLPSSAEMVAFESGTLDGATMTDPHLTAAIRDYGIEVLGRITEVLPGYQFSLLAFGPRLLDEEPHVGRRFMVGYLRGVRDYSDGKTPDNLAAIARATGLEEGILEQSCWMPVRRDGVANIESLAEYVEWYKYKGWLDLVPDLEETWDGSFVEHAIREVDGIESKSKGDE